MMDKEEEKREGKKKKEKNKRNKKRNKKEEVKLNSRAERSQQILVTRHQTEQPS